MQIRVADYIARFLADRGITDMFLVTGGGAMHLNDAFGREKRLQYVCCHHEQACSMAAESYARLTGRPALVNVTTGPGGINSMNGVYGAFTDSIPMIVVSGQVKRETIASLAELPDGLALRQLGDQEVDIIPMVTPITKYAISVHDPKTIRFHLEKAWHLATTGRPGPVWIDVPIDVQSTRLTEDDIAGLAGFDDIVAGRVVAVPAEQGWLTGPGLAEEVDLLVEKLKSAQRPVVLAGAGVRISGTCDKFRRVVETLGIPVTTGWNAHDAIHNEHPCYVGRPGTVGDRAGNFAVQNADLVIILGSRLNIRQVSYGWKTFARAAEKFMVDIDRAELNKPTLSIDHKIHADLRDFLTVLEQNLAGYTTPAAHKQYLIWCMERRQRYPTVLPEYHSSEKINPYVFIEKLFQELSEDEVVVTGDGTACVVAFQAGYIRSKQRLYTNSGSASMGYDLPAAIGACIGRGRKRIICLAGDGSIMMNLQELQTIVGLNLPIKIFLLNNYGYHSIRQTQQAYFKDNLIGLDPTSGVTFPDFVRMAEGFGLHACRVDKHAELVPVLKSFLLDDKPGLCEVVLDPEQQFSPKLASRVLPDGRMASPALEDLAPFLSRDELRSNMLIPLEDE